MPGPVDIEALLRHREFVRRLARRLVRDDARAEDVVQETYVAALRNPPRHAGALRAWLATVVRKLAWTQNRSERRRALREQASTPPAAAPRAEDVLERAEWHQRLVNHVMRLEEPYRSTLLLRYFEDLNSSEIARLHDVPAATVRTRLRRGLEQVRKKLDATEGRAHWFGALLLLAGPEGGAPPPPPPSAAWPWAAAAGLGLVAVTGLVWFVASTGPGPTERLPPSAGRLSGARVVVERLERRPWHAWAYDPWELWGRARTDATGRATLEGVPDGYVRVLAAREGYGRGEAFAFLPTDFEQPVVVDLPPEAPRRVEAVPGAQVEIVEPGGSPWRPELKVPPADGAGRTTIHGIAAGAHAEVRLWAPGYAPYGPRRLPARHLRAELTPLSRTVAWPIDGVGPPAGAALELRRVHEPGARFRGRVDAGHVVADALPPGDLYELLAIADDGTFARLTAEAGTGAGPPVRFGAPPTLTLRVRDTAGAPVAGIAIRLFHEDAAVFPDSRTDAGGLAIVPVFARDPVKVRIRESRRAPFRTVRTFDPRRGDARMEVTLPCEREVSLRVRCDGTPGLPSAYELFKGPTRVAPDELSIDGERAQLRFRMRPAHGDVFLLAPGYLPATIRVERDEVDVDLIPAGTLVVHVALASPRKQPYRLELLDADDERVDLRRGPWSFGLHPGPDHVVRETMMPPGYYRVRDVTSGKATREFLVLPGRSEVQLYLDLQDAWPPREPSISGFVTGPGLDLRLAEVVAVGPRGDRRRAPVSPDGTFVLPWSGSGVLEVSARHPQASAPTPALALSGPRDDVILRLRSRHRASARLVPGADLPHPGGAEPRVRLFAAAEGQAPLTLDVSLENGRVRFDGFRPGRYTLWFDLPGVTPLTLRDVVLADGVTDLGTLAVQPGTALRFRILGREGEILPELAIAARALLAPRYRRSLHTGGADQAALAGLGAGGSRSPPGSATPA